MAKKIIGVDINYTTKENKKVSVNLELEQVINTKTNEVKTTLRYIDGNTGLIYTSWKDIAEIDRK